MGVGFCSRLCDEVVDDVRSTGKGWMMMMEAKRRWLRHYTHRVYLNEDGADDDCTHFLLYVATLIILTDT